ncbi:MAG: integration host factor subunit alpha [Betaproteobacteria bacterium]|nr:integration host factor subunit alpha [Betaproteobacteria bacterium]
MSGNLTRKDIAHKLQAHVGTFAEARRFTSVFFDTLSDAIAAHDKIKIHNFGVFRCIQKKARMGRNPKTKKAAAISARRVVNFTASHILKKRLSGNGRKQ